MESYLEIHPLHFQCHLTGYLHCIAEEGEPTSFSDVEESLSVLEDGLTFLEDIQCIIKTWIHSWQSRSSSFNF